jgi:hypothetical protein
MQFNLRNSCTIVLDRTTDTWEAQIKQRNVFVTEGL